MPKVTARLRQAATDQDRQRLGTLRYRLVASDQLTLRWPGGLARLASIDPRTRQAAAEELASLATDADRLLLAELFRDPDPLVREISLRALQHVGGEAAVAAMVELLSDPELNVRAAVLKQLEENPDPDMIDKVTEYLAHEKDADLVVHGIRVLRADSEGRGSRNSGKVLRTLLALLKHPAWQVRAEAAEAVGKIISALNWGWNTGEVDEPTKQLQADTYAALIELLGDADAFVASRAVEGLSSADTATAVEPLVRAVKRHPDLGSKILVQLGEGKKTRALALPHLRKFASDPNPALRAAALDALFEAVPDLMDEELAAAVAERDGKVRVKAAEVLFRLMEKHREQAVESVSRERDRMQLHSAPATAERLAWKVVWILAESLSDTTAPGAAQPPADASRGVRQAAEGLTWRPRNDDASRGRRQAEHQAPGGPAAKGDAGATDPWDRWLYNYYAGEGRPRWIGPLRGPLEKMLHAEAAEERMAAAAALVPLGRADLALPEVRRSLISTSSSMKRRRCCRGCLGRTARSCSGNCGPSPAKTIGIV